LTHFMVAWNASSMPGKRVAYTYTFTVDSDTQIATNMKRATS
jgi:hypothetical protein